MSSKTYTVTQWFLAGNSVVTREGNMRRPQRWVAKNLETGCLPALEYVHLQMNGPTMISMGGSHYAWSFKTFNGAMPRGIHRPQKHEVPTLLAATAAGPGVC